MTWEKPHLRKNKRKKSLCRIPLNRLKQIHISCFWYAGLLVCWASGEDCWVKGVSSTPEQDTIPRYEKYHPKPKVHLTLSYSSKINGYLYHQRVSPPLKKTPWYLSEGNAALPVGCDSPLQSGGLFVWLWTFWVWVWQLSAEIMVH